MRALTAQDVITNRAMMRNIRAMLRRDETLANDAREWYRRAYRFTHRLSRISGYSPMVIASVIAVLSPSVEWRDNRRMAIALIENVHATQFRNRIGNVVRFVGYGRNIAKARAILQHNNPALCSGPKVTAFRDAILGVRDYAVIDVHATNIALGTVNKFSGPAGYLHSIALAYESVAKSIGWQVCEVQAATWIIYKSTKGKNA